VREISAAVGNLQARVAAALGEKVKTNSCK
jgi:hypothetical protein